MIASARAGQMAVLQFHGVPDVIYPWVDTSPDAFQRYMEHLKSAGFRTLALRNAGEFLGPAPDDPMLKSRYKPAKDAKLPLPVEVDATQAELPYWRGIMRQHGYSPMEASRITGMLEASMEPERVAGPKLLPYPGGRHMRIGFLEGAVSPMRGTKASVFLPWAGAGYVVVDLPEAIIAEGKIEFLGHTHIPTNWDERNIPISNKDWIRNNDGSLSSEWTLPDRVTVGASIRLNGQAVYIECWIRNGSEETLKNIRAQVCILFKGAPGFAAQTNANKRLVMPRAVVRAVDGKRWIATEWEDCQRVWGNERCPCMHSDPKFPDCAPGETVRRKGRMWFGGD